MSRNRWTLHAVELFNWGLFDGAVHTFPFHGENTWITGQKGAGKSSALDALVTLLVPARHVVFNSSSGAKKNERTVDSYLTGTYAQVETDNDSGAVLQRLRPEPGRSAVLAKFQLSDTTTTVAIAAVWNRTASGNSAVYVVSEGNAGLPELLSGSLTWKQQLKALRNTEGVQVFTTWKEYREQVQQTLGLTLQGSRLWFEALSMKNVDNLTLFTRQHMLTYHDAAFQQAASVSEHYDDLAAAAAAMHQAEQQITALTPIVAWADTYDQCTADITQWTRVRDDVVPAFLAREQLRNAQQRHDQATADVAAITQQLAELDVQRQYQQQEGLSDSDRAQLARRADQFTRRCHEAKISAPETADQFTVMREELPERITASQEDYTASVDQVNDAVTAEKNARDALAAARRRQNTVAASGSRMAAALLDTRAQLCAAVEQPESAMPFAGELCEVNPQFSDWEHAAQVTFKTLAEVLLVPEHSRPAVAQWIDDNNLTMRIMYFSHPTDEQTTVDIDATVGTLAEVMRLRKDAGTASVWLAEQLTQLGTHIRVDSPAELTHHDRAITRAGHMSLPSGLAVKDDRFPADDTSWHQLGWNDPSAQTHADNAVADAEKHHTHATQHVTTTRAAAEQLLAILTARQSLLQDYPLFADVHVPSADTITTDNDSNENESEGEDIAAQWDALQRQLGHAEAEVNHADHDQTAAHTTLAKFSPMTDDDFQQIDQLLTVDDVTTDTLASHVTTIVANITKTAEDITEQALPAMQTFITKLASPNDQNHLAASWEYANEFRDVLNRIEHDDLPRVKNEFHVSMNQTIVRELKLLHGTLLTVEQEVHQAVGTINSNLADIPYAPTSVIRMRAVRNADPRVAGFRDQLERAVTAATHINDNPDDFTIITDFLDTITTANPTTAVTNSDYVAHVTDPRQWFDYVIDEIDTTTDTVMNTYRSGDGKSTGEKEKLAYCVLIAALSHQFTSTTPHFGMVAIDEAFSAGTTESVNFALNLLSELNLQWIVVTPGAEKRSAIAPQAQHTAYVHRVENRSEIAWIATDTPADGIPAQKS